MKLSVRAPSYGVAVAGLVLFSSVVEGQGGGGRRGAPPGGNPDQPQPAQSAQPARMSAPPRSPAEMLLRQKEHLQLTDDQAKRLEALGKTQRDALKPQRAGMLRAEADLADAEDHENFDAQRSALEKMAKIRIDEDIARRRAMKDARDILTPEQRDLVAAPMMGGMGRGGFGNGMMPGGRGMGGPGARAMRPPGGPPVRPPTQG